MNEFPSQFDYHTFEREVKQHSRYFRSNTCNNFLQALKDSCETNKRIWKFPDDLRYPWRARLDCEWRPIYDNDNDHVADDPIPHSSMGAPPSDKATEGRLNPKGIPMLYMASDRDAAIAEVRPRIGQYVTIAKLEINPGLRFINCFELSGHRQTKLHLRALLEPEKEHSIWMNIDNAFSKITTNHDASSDYVPTQILAEFFKKNGFDGVVYKSALAEAGYNILLFNPSNAKVVQTQVVKITPTNLNHKWVGGARFRELDDIES